MIKQEMTPVRMTRIIRSVQYMAVMAELIKMEHLADMDTRFKNPQANQFAARIAKDADAIQLHLATNKNVNIKFAGRDYVEEYAGELYRVFHYFIGLPVEQIKTVMDQLESLSIKIIEPTDN
jgi:hypothetical protein